jgi:thymidylate synthase ThyX
VDLNRDYRSHESPETRAHLELLKSERPFDLCLCLHEDWEAKGFYLYEANPEQQPSLAAAIIEAVKQVCPIDASEIIEGRAANGGIIRPNLDPQSRPQWPESFWLLQHRTRLSYTLEAPSDFPLQTRVDALTSATLAAIGQSPARGR